MKKFFAVCVLPLLTLTACQNIPDRITQSKDKKQPLNTVELQHPNIMFTILATGKTYRSGDVFDSPKTIDCSKLTLKSDSFENAIEAGALIVKIQTPKQVKVKIQTPQNILLKFTKQDSNNIKNKETHKIVNIKPLYGGVLALCNVSDRATGPDSRSYRIRGLDKYLVKGKNGLVSVVAAVLNSKFGSKDFSWMLWLTDRTTTFTNYQNDMSIRKTSITPK